MRTLSILILASLCGCPTSTDDDEFLGGDFQFETYGVTDACFDGGFEALFLPDGEGTTNEWGDPIYIPPEDELPSTYSISMPSPFNAMEVTVDGDAGTREVDGAANDNVELDPDDYPGCMVNMAIDVDLVIDGPEEVHGTAVLHTSSFDEGTCPAVDSDPCDITLDLRGNLVE